MVATIKDIAQKAGVSISTVSRVINGNYPVSSDVQKRVKRVMEELDFHPNAVARSLRSRKSKLIGFIIADLSNQFFMDIAKGLEKEINKIDDQLLIASSDNEPEKESKIINSLIERNIDGLVIASSGGESLAAIEKCKENDIPVILIDRSFDEVGVSQVLWNDYEVSVELVERLIKAGHKKIACLNVMLSNPTGKLRLDGYRDALINNGVEIDESIISGSNFGSDEAYEFVIKTFSSENRPTAIFCTNNQMAFGALRAFNELGITVGSDVSMVLFGNLLAHNYYPLAITHSDQDGENMGSVAGNLLIETMNGDLNSIKRIIVDAPLVEGDSIAEI